MKRMKKGVEMKGGSMDKVEKAREFFLRLESGKVGGKSVGAGKSNSNLEALERVRKDGGDIRQESLRRFRVQQRLAEVREVKLKRELVC